MFSYRMFLFWVLEIKFRKMLKKKKFNLKIYEKNYIERKKNFFFFLKKFQK
jgi:biotin synthase-related radical SAM superfamily protein